MHRNRRMELVLAASALAALVGLWLAWPYLVVSARGSDPLVHTDPAVAGVAKGSSTAKHASDDPRVERNVRGPGEAGRLTLHIRRRDGGKVKGRVYWTTSPRPFLTSSLMAPEHGFALPATGVRQVEHDGTARLEVPPGTWTWLRATAEGDPFISRYERIPPFSRERTIELELSGGVRALHVFLLESDLTTPASNRSVQVYTTDMHSVAMPKLRTTQRTDAYGYAVFRDLPPGGFLICAPGARPGDPAPYTERLVLPAEVPMTEMASTLVVPETRIEVKLQVNATFDKVQGYPPKLFLKRKDKKAGELFPMAGYLRPGKQEIALRVPAGDYEVGVLPVGLVEVPDAQRTFEVAAGKENRFPVLLQGTKPLIEVELAGLSGLDFPVTVYPQPIEQALDDDVGLMYCGPYHWNLPKLRIAAPLVPGFLIVTGRYNCWISKQLEHLTGTRIRVPLTEATKLVIHWHVHDLARKGGVVVSVASGSGSFFRRLRPQLVLSAGRMLPTLVGTIVVPRGNVELECLLEETGATAWKRTVNATKKAQTVEVADQ